MEHYGRAERGGIAVDVLIVGAGLSGIGAAHHLQEKCPGRTYAILEARDAIGGTWDLFRYPGVRSDSDMYTLGYSFRPWTNAKSIADGPDILDYVRETAKDGDIERHIRFGHRVVRADWSSAERLWTVSAEYGSEVVAYTCNFLFMCSGYYDYREGYTPEFAGRERFGGTIVHPQHWPEDLDYTGKRVVVIGSGATAVTLVPAMAETAEHVTMLQRSPSYVMSVPNRDKTADRLRRLLPAKAAYAVSRWKNVSIATFFFQISRRRPELVKKFIRKGVAAQLGPDFDVDKHFTPSYNPWDQRMCLVPRGDLFKAIRSGKASVVTDHIDSFTETGIALQSGAMLDADIIVTATGLDLIPMGGLAATVDGEPVDLPKSLAYKGMMLSGVPNAAFAMGYTNASWTLKCDLTCEYVCRLLNHMDEHGYRKAVAANIDPAVTPMPIIDFSSGYVQRAVDKFPQQGSHRPWRLYQNYALDIVTLKFGGLDDKAMVFT